MPRFVLELNAVSSSQFADALRLTYQRFPEIAVDRRDVSGARAPTTEPEREKWLCRAPSAAHLRRWALAAQVRVTTVTPVEADRSSNRARFD